MTIGRRAKSISGRPSKKAKELEAAVQMYEAELDNKTQESKRKSKLLYDQVWPEICQKQQETYEQSISNIYEVIQNFGVAMTDHGVSLQSAALGLKIKRSSIEIRKENVQRVFDESQPDHDIDPDLERRGSFTEDNEKLEARPTPIGSRDSKSTVSGLYLDTQTDDIDRHQFLSVLPVKHQQAEILYTFDGSTVCLTLFIRAV